ncbi:MAG: hypothetical protein FWE86_00245 [Oscillospiraceae bacterium]|nr:hypothetical protein [Oscillospiraceae bacterium]
MSVKDIYSLDEWAFYDLWLLYSIFSWKKGSNLAYIISAGDYYNHAIFLPEELNFGMSKLIYNGYVESLESGRFRQTRKAKSFFRKNGKPFEGCFDTLFRLKPIFTALPIKSGCVYREYFTQDEIDSAVKKYTDEFEKALKSLKNKT